MTPGRPGARNPGQVRGEEVGSFALVLHTHLPWLLHHGAWPVGEEWLHQAWADAYIPLAEVLGELADEGRQDVLTLGVTPVVAAQLDDPEGLRRQHTWLGFWQARALALASHPDAAMREVGAREHLRAVRTTALFEQRWSAGASPVLRDLAERGVVELLGGPAAHPFQPLLDERVARFSLRTGLDDHRWRLGRTPAGLWAPECAYRPGLEAMYADAGITHVMVDGPTLAHVGRSSADAWTLGDSEVAAFGRNLEVSYRVWSPRRGYPGGAWYRDFHAFEHGSGFRPYRVTSTRLPSDQKALYEPDRATAAVERDARDFVSHVREHLVLERDRRDGRPGLVVAAYDTELFGHWWHEGPQWLARVLRLLPEAGVRVTTLQRALEAGAVAGRVDPEPGTWGAGKDFHVWDGEPVRDLVADHELATERVLAVLDKAWPWGHRDAALDQLARSLLLALASDWAFMVSKDSAAGYARDRHRRHTDDVLRLADLLAAGRGHDAAREAARQGATDGPFPHLDARLLAATG
jgi:1,4-alpha-glucan branching enzyme